MSNDAQQHSGSPRFDPRFSPEFQPGYTGTDSAPPSSAPTRTTQTRATLHQADASRPSAPSPSASAPPSRTTAEPLSPPASLAPPVSLLEPDAGSAPADGRSVAARVLIAHARNPFVIALAAVAVLSGGVGLWAYSTAYERYSNGNIFTSQADYVAWELMMRYAPLCGFFGVAILVGLLFSLARASFATTPSPDA